MIEDRPRHGGSYDLVPPGRMPIHVLAFGAVVTTQPARVLLATGHLAQRGRQANPKTTLRDLVILRDLANAYHSSKKPRSGLKKGILPT